MADRPPDNDAEGRPGEGDLLPGWSSLVILLSLFGIISVVALLAILKGAEARETHDGGAVRSYRPSDFPEIDFNEPLLPSVVDSSAAEQAGFNVPPPPLSDEGYFPCSECHADMDADLERRELMVHDEIQLNHGPEDRWCFDCHNPDDRDRLRLVNGKLVEFDESYKLCGQCHGTIYRDWREGIHGRRRGFWNGAKSYLLCAHCHNPHDPAFEPIKPLPPPVRPGFLGRSAALPEEPEESEP